MWFMFKNSLIKFGSLVHFSGLLTINGYLTFLPRVEC